METQAGYRAISVNLESLSGRGFGGFRELIQPSGRPRNFLGSAFYVHTYKQLTSSRKSVQAPGNLTGRGFGGSMELVRSLILTASAVQRIFAAAFVSRPAYPAVRPSSEPPGKFLAWFSKPGFRPAQVPHGMWKHRLDSAGDGETTETIEQPLRNH